MHRFRILFPSEVIVFFTKEMLCFVVIADSFQQIISRLEVKQVSKVFALMKWKKKHETSDVHFIVDV